MAQGLLGRLLGPSTRCVPYDAIQSRSRAHRDIAGLQLYIAERPSFGPRLAMSIQFLPGERAILGGHYSSGACREVEAFLCITWVYGVQGSCERAVTIKMQRISLVVCVFERR